ncbi:MAG TPA: NAD(P)-dependent alcohol dehydrogenase [Chthoniobacterales bacterium]|nr:NAD(P)-dependent alcohol dehydrogenase [Chthoniobacterales bacterium]
MKIKRVLKWIVLTGLVGIALWLFIAYWTSTNDCEQITKNPTHPMKAILSCEYGAENLKLEQIEKPAPADNEVLVHVRAASVNPADGHEIRGSWIGRPFSGMRKPKNTRFGTDFAGVVEAAGKNVTDFKPGDEVFGAKNGAVADYVCVKAERAIVMKPGNITFEQAGSVGIAGITALQGLRDKGHIQSGQKVLINGASGGVGTFAVQIAKAYGAEVTAVCSTHNVDLVKSIGADHVIDYTKEDFTKTDQQYDMIYDLVGNHGFSERRRILTPKGICVLAGIGGAGLHPETMGRIAANFWNAFRSNFTKQKFVFYIAKLTKDDLNALRELMETGKVSPVIDRTYKISETQAALQYLEEGHARGKVVITVTGDQ